MYKWLGPMMGNYHLWQSKFKQAFDPNNASDASHYIPPYDELKKDMEEYVPPVMEDVLNDLKN